MLQALLDETARRAVWRAGCDPAKMSGALSWPYTPLGSVVPDYHIHYIQTIALNGRLWSQATEAIYDYMERNAAAICAAFQDEQEPYDDLSGRWTE